MKKEPKKSHSSPISTNNNVVDNVQKQMPTDDALASMLSILTAMADSTRLKILLALREQELCVSDLCEVLNMSQSAVSHQLRTLRNAYCVKSRRSGKLVFYSLDDHHVDQILSVALSHVYHQ